MQLILFDCFKRQHFYMKPSMSNLLASYKAHWLTLLLTTVQTVILANKSRPHPIQIKEYPSQSLLAHRFSANTLYVMVFWGKSNKNIKTSCAFTLFQSYYMLEGKFFKSSCGSKGPESSTIYQRPCSNKPDSLY